MCTKKCPAVLPLAGDPAVLSVGLMINIPQVLYAVVGWIAVDVVNQLRRPRAVHQNPS
jgi:hypothetical protein